MASRLRWPTTSRSSVFRRNVVWPIIAWNLLHTTYRCSRSSLEHMSNIIDSTWSLRSNIWRFLIPSIWFQLKLKSAFQRMKNSNTINVITALKCIYTRSEIFVVFDVVFNPIAWLNKSINKSIHFVVAYHFTTVCTFSREKIFHKELYADMRSYKHHILCGAIYELCMVNGHMYILVCVVLWQMKYVSINKLLCIVYFSRISICWPNHDSMEEKNVDNTVWRKVDARIMRFAWKSSKPPRKLESALQTQIIHFE